MNVARLNFSHGTADESNRENAHAWCCGKSPRDKGNPRRASSRPARAEDAGNCAVFPEAQDPLDVGDHFRLSTSHPAGRGNAEHRRHRLPPNWSTIAAAGDEKLLLDDGPVYCASTASARMKLPLHRDAWWPRSPTTRGHQTGRGGACRRLR